MEFCENNNGIGASGTADDFGVHPLGETQNKELVALDQSLF
jgi:hypothetical protein